MPREVTPNKVVPFGVTNNENATSHQNGEGPRTHKDSSGVVLDIDNIEGNGLAASATSASFKRKTKFKSNRSSAISNIKVRKVSNSIIWLASEDPLDEISVSNTSLRFVNRRNGTDTMTKNLEVSFAIMEADQKKGLVQRSTWIFLLFNVAMIFFDVSKYIKGKNLNKMLVLLVLHGTTAALAVTLLVFTHSRHYRFYAGKVCGVLAFLFVVSLVFASLWMQDASYVEHIAFMLYLFGYLPVQTYTASALTVLQIVSFLLGHFLRLQTDSDAGISSNSTAVTSEFGYPLQSENQLILKTFLMSGFVSILAYLSYDTEHVSRTAHLLHKLAEKKAEKMRQQEVLSDGLLRNMLPGELIVELSRPGIVDETKLIAEHDEVSIMFCKIANFSENTQFLQPDEVVYVLSTLWTKFDELVDLHKTYKVETVGEEYLVCSGCTGPEILNHAQLTINTALSFLDAVNKARSDNADLIQLFPKLSVKIGIHTGPVVAGLVGMRFKLIGDTVNTSSRMSANSVPGKICISKSTFGKICTNNKSRYLLEKRDPIKVKGKGTMQTYFVMGKNPRRNTMEFMETQILDLLSEQEENDETVLTEPSSPQLGPQPDQISAGQQKLLVKPDSTPSEKPILRPRNAMDAGLSNIAHIDRDKISSAKLGDCASELMELWSPRSKELRDIIQQSLLPPALEKKGPVLPHVASHQSTQESAQESTLSLMQYAWLFLGHDVFSASSATNEDIANESLFMADQLDAALTFYRRFSALGLIACNFIPIVSVFFFYKENVDSTLARAWLILCSGFISLTLILFGLFTFERTFALNTVRRTRCIMAVLVIAGAGIVFSIQSFHTIEIEQYQSTNRKVNADTGSLALFIIFVYHAKLVNMFARLMVTLGLTCFYVAWASGASNTSGESTVVWDGAILLAFSIGQMIVQFLYEAMQRAAFNSTTSARVQQSLLRAATKRNDELLSMRLPKSIVERLKSGVDIADNFKCVTILQTDVVGFTSFSSQVTPLQLRKFVNSMFDQFSAIVGRHGLYTIEIIGDAFLVVGGCPVPQEDAVHAAAACAAALEFNHTLEKLAKDLPTLIGVEEDDPASVAAKQLTIRLGLHSGPAVAGVVGVKDPRYHLFGETVNVAQGMESQGVPGRVHCTDETYKCLAGTPMCSRFKFIVRPASDLKASPKYDGSYTKQTYFVEFN